VSSAAFALISGIVYTLLGIAGVFPAAMVSGYLGLFPMNVPLSVLHLLIGVCGLAAAALPRYARIYARATSLILGVLGVMGLIAGLQGMFGLPLHGHNIWLHLGSAALAAYCGWRANIPVLHEQYQPDDDRRHGAGDRRDTITTVSRERRHGSYDRRTPLGA
jgi:hypothetical protein